MLCSPQAVTEISKLLERGRVSKASFGPLSHTLTRLVQSEERVVVAYATRSLKLLALDESLAEQAAVAGVPQALVQALHRWEEDAPCLREILG